MPKRDWSAYPKLPKVEELKKLEKTLRELRIPHWSLTRYARYYQGAPDFLLPQLKLAVWLLGSEVSPRQEREQAAMRSLGWTVVIPETANAAMQIVKAKGT